MSCSVRSQSEAAATPQKKPGQFSLAGRNTVIPSFLECAVLGGDRRAGRVRALEPQCVFKNRLLDRVVAARPTAAASTATVLR